jgi:hypothetical protein
MYNMKIKTAAASLILLMIAGLATAAIPTTPSKDKDGPDLPSPLCDHVRVEAGNKLHSRVYADGVQIYRWDGLSWVLVGPDATLFANANYDGKVGRHYAGPTWESNSGSKVVGARLYGCQPDSNSIPWLLLEAVSTSGPGIYSSVTFIQRLNTKGGLPPAGPGSFVGEKVQIPYTAEYYFYREQ